jgi:phosphohistidine phosphatase
MPAAKQLFVLRHAKSSWDDPGLADHERPLAPRGIRAAELLREHVKEEGIRPALVLCSPARRTLETLERVSPGGEVLIEPDLYGASSADLVQRLRQVPATTASVMVIGHNPAAQTLVLRLVRANGLHSPATADSGRGGDLADIERKFPTGALATLRFECPWSELAPGCAELVGYIRPRSLA